MTSICPGGGASARKAFVAPQLLVAAGAAANYLGNAGGMWASILAAAIGVKAYDAENACLTDPPGWPTLLTPLEITAVLTSLIMTPEYTSATQKLNQYLDNVLWYLMCECVGAATPAQPAFPAPPAGAPSVARPGEAPSSRLCWTGQFPSSGPNMRPETSQGALDLSPQLLPLLGAQSTVLDIAGFNQDRYVAPAQLPTHARIVLDAPVGADAGVTMWYQTGAGLGTGAPFPATLNNTSDRHVDSGVVALPAGVTHWAITAYKRSTYPVTTEGSVCLELFGTSGLTPTSCCPPDTISTQLLEQILSVVTVHQRYGRPFALVPGPSHTGATGTGSAAIPKCVGIAVTITARPADKKTAAGNPTYVYDLGWCSVSEVGGMLQERRIMQEQFVWLPEQCQVADHFNWYLQPGVTMTWQELYAES